VNGAIKENLNIDNYLLIVTIMLAKLVVAENYEEIKNTPR
jgi:hypothetical protein|tara:strand:- start:391 stop:510 length:120 start_codon:yes stop_codon:yes gene_type:complete